MRLLSQGLLFGLGSLVLALDSFSENRTNERPNLQRTLKGKGSSGKRCKSSKSPGKGGKGSRKEYAYKSSKGSKSSSISKGGKSSKFPKGGKSSKFPKGRKNSKSSKSPKSGKGYTDCEEVPPVLMPTLEPTLSPVPCDSDEERDRYIREVVTSISGDNVQGPQQQALTWILEEDLGTNACNDDVVITQRYSLAALYYSTSGNDWIDNSNWLDSDTDECEWFGVDCDGGKVASITLGM